MEEQSTVDSQKKDAAPYKQCLNCGTDLQGTYCHKCGQQASNPTPKVWEFILEYLNNAFIWDTKCVTTIWQLIRRPGYLTNAFNAGKFVAYEHPLKLNMFFLFVFVTLFLLFSDIHKAGESFSSLTKNELVRPYLSLSIVTEDPDYSLKMERSERDTVLLALPLEYAKEFPKIVHVVSEKTNHYGEKLDTLVASIPKILIQDKILISNGSEVYAFSNTNDLVDQSIMLEILARLGKKLLEILTQYFPLIFLLTSPLLAFAVKLLHRKRKKPTISFFIFALHYTAFIELMLLLVYLLYLTIHPSFDVLEWIMILSSCVYLTIAVKNVYNNHSWTKSIMKAFFISLVYLLICLMAFFVIFVIAIFAIALQTDPDAILVA